MALVPADQGRDHRVLELGKTQKLKITRIVEQGAYLNNDSDQDVLLPRREVPHDAEVGQELEVFIYRDSEDRLTATQELPYAHVGEFVQLKVKTLERVGAFLDWGLTKDLLLPFAEQTRDLKVGHYVIVHIYIDKSDRIAASMRLDRFMDKEASGLKEGDKVDLMIAGKTDLGFKAIVNGRFWGVLFSNEVFERLDYGQKLPGYIKHIRPDGKIDLALQPAGHLGASDVGEKILMALKQRGGFLPLTDKTSPETIYELFGVSKKKYKMALGGLYKKRLIVIQEDGIRLV